MSRRMSWALMVIGGLLILGGLLALVGVLLNGSIGLVFGQLGVFIVGIGVGGYGYTHHRRLRLPRS